MDEHVTHNGNGKRSVTTIGWGFIATVTVAVVFAVVLYLSAGAKLDKAQQTLNRVEQLGRSQDERGEVLSCMARQTALSLGAIGRLNPTVPQTPEERQAAVNDFYTELGKLSNVDETCA